MVIAKDTELFVESIEKASANLKTELLAGCNFMFNKLANIDCFQAILKSRVLDKSCKSYNKQKIVLMYNKGSVKSSEGW